MPGIMSAFAGMGKEAAQSAIGMVEKAVIVIVDARGLESGDAEIVQVAKKGKKSRDTNDITESLRNKNDFRTRDLHGKEAQMVLNREIKAIRKDGASKTRALKVQFNPSTLQLVGRGGGRTPQMNYNSAGGGQIVVGSLNGRIDFSVQLIFDRVNNQDAFMNEKFTLNPTSVAKTVANGLLDKSYEVQTEVEGFIAALNGNATRSMRFIWGHMIYKGRLNSVNAVYTMFNTAGQPIRAVVNFGMTCTESNSNNENLGMWDARYRATFTEIDAKGNTKGKNIAGNQAYQKKLQNLLNL